MEANYYYSAGQVRHVNHRLSFALYPNDDDGDGVESLLIKKEKRTVDNHHHPSIIIYANL